MAFLHLQVFRYVCGCLGKQTSVFTTSKSYLSEIHICQGLYTGVTLSVPLFSLGSNEKVRFFLILKYCIDSTEAKSNKHKDGMKVWMLVVLGISSFLLALSMVGLMFVMWRWIKRKRLIARRAKNCK